ncbi:MAG: NUDIX domain-containing protein [Flavitalea sp.]
MMRRSAGILLFRNPGKQTEFFLVHPGGPLWKKKDLGVWSIPKGEYEEGEDPLAAAKREFEEETGSKIKGECIQLTPVMQKSGKLVSAWAVEGDIDPSTIKSNLFPFQWPPKSGKYIQISEVDRGEWYSAAEARLKIIPGQAALIEEFISMK